MSNLPLHAFSAANVREFDRRAIEGQGISGLELMQRAGQAAFSQMCSLWPQCNRLIVFCGPGNNGGDGYVVATLARKAGMQVTVMTLAPLENLQGDARLAYDLFVAANGQIENTDLSQLGDADVIVDAMLGTGLQRSLEGKYLETVEAINNSKQAVFSLDIPTGLHADTGTVLGSSINAQATMTFIALKTGLLTGEGPEKSGKVFFHTLDVPREIFIDVTPQLNILNAASFTNVLARRSRTSHKGDYGHVLLVGGNVGMPGAVRMAGEAALRSGAGLVSVATREEHAATLNVARPELMVTGVSNADELTTMIDSATVIALGPGLGRDSWAQELFGVALKSELPMVVDADGLNLLAKQNIRRGNWVLTPHPGEAGRLLGSDAKTVQQDRIAAVEALAEKYAAIVVLKGAGSLVASTNDNNVYCCNKGNPGMSTAGMGDVLTGVVAGLLAQGLSLEMAARLGVFIHSTAGDAAAGSYERGLLATDLMPHIRKLVNAF